MKLDLDTSNLDWNNATIRDYRYVHHLMLMIHERWTKLGYPASGFPITYVSNGLIPSSYSNTITPIFQMCRYSPGGSVSWNQLAAIYHAMLYLGLYVYFNPDNFKEEYYKDGDLRKLPVFSLKDMCEIADFDFFAHPFIPGQPIDYYSQFLYPIKKVLSAYKQISSNTFAVKHYSYYSSDMNSKVGTHWSYGQRYDDCMVLPIPRKTVDDRKYTYEGRDLIDFLSDSKNHLKCLKDYYECYKNGENYQEKYPDRYGDLHGDTCQSDSPVLGYNYIVSYSDFRWSNYNQNMDSDDNIIYSIDSGFVITSYAVSFGNLFKVAFPFPAGIPYKTYLYHTTASVNWNGKNENVPSKLNDPRYFNSPWPMIIEKGSGTVPANNEVVEWIELPSWDALPGDWPKTTKDVRLYEMEIKDYDGGGNYISTKKSYTNAPMRCQDIYAAFYHPLFVFDFSSRFQYN